MTIGAIVLGRFVRVVTEFTWCLSQVGIMRVWYYLLGLLSQFLIISPMTPEADLHGDKFGRGILRMAGFTNNAPALVPVRQK
jgi:hypothetical protein